MYTFIDLFAGSGGFSQGLRSAGLKPLAKVELDGAACETLRYNFPDAKIIETDIRSISDEEIKAFGPVDIIVGGPPCQGFSVAGSTQFGIEDPRNELFRWFLHWVTVLRPKAAVIENVPGMLSRRNGRSTVLEAVREELDPIGYTVTSDVLNAADFGVPQARRRAFIVAALGRRPFVFPHPTHSEMPEQNSLFANVNAYTTVGQAISDLPEIAAGEGTDETVPYSTAATSEYQSRMREGSSGVCNHVAMKHTTRLIERFKTIKPGQSLKDVAISHGQVAKITGKKTDKPFKYNNYRLDASRPSLAIPASFQSLFLHPRLHRNLTAREAARLMGFPDTFIFKGKRTAMSWEPSLSQYNQIGNAVCPPVAEALGKSLILHLAENYEVRAKEEFAKPFLRFSSLRAPAKLPETCKGLPSEIVDDLTAAAAHFGVSGRALRFKGFDLPTASLPLALIFATELECPICSRGAPPFGQHDGRMCFLISKENTDSLVKNGQDHGLDYHLRTALQIPHQIGHYVGEQLEELGLVHIENMQNPRTGRFVRGMRVADAVRIDNALRRKVLTSFGNSAPSEKICTVAITG